MFKFLRPVLITFLVLIATTMLILVLLLDTTPKFPLQWQPNLDLARAIYNKASEQTKQNQDLTFDTPTINHLANSLLNRYFKSATHIDFTPSNQAIVEGTLQLPKNWSGYFLNIHFELNNHEKSLTFSDLHIGRLPIPQFISYRVIYHLLNHSFLRHYYLLGQEHIETIQIKDQQIVARYQLNTNAPGIGLATQLDPKVLRFYQTQVELIASQHNPHWRLSLADLLKPLFKQAVKRSDLQSAVMENIAIISAVSAYVNDKETPFYMVVKRPPSNTSAVPVYLYKRTDQAKHFMLSAVLTTTGGDKLANIMGQEKELRDAQIKSGFSFIDLAADRAGMRFGEHAIRSPQAAKALQQLMADIDDYRAFMPDVLDLPEKLTQAQFVQHFDAVGSKPFKAMLRVIDERINALPLYKP